jgi:hypothetical protein
MSYLCLPDAQRFGAVDELRKMTDGLIRFHHDHAREVCSYFFLFSIFHNVYDHLCSTWIFVFRVPSRLVWRIDTVHLIR